MAHSDSAKTPGYTFAMTLTSKACVLAVGTELTSGQITNRNAAWISQKLIEIGLQTQAHLTVPDERKTIREALEFLEPQAEFLFITGGLGPTSDDFTRELISEWSSLALEYHEKSWIKIEDRLKSRGLPIGEFQKQQCFFPKGAQVLDNSVGTANAFYFKIQKQNKLRHVWALPGPPNEIAAVWNDHIQTQLKELTRDLNPYVTFSWDALGIGEALAPSLVEPVAQGSGGELGYRVHMPYLEIKFSFYKSEEEKMKPFIEKIDQALKPYTVCKNGEDIIQHLQALTANVPHLFVCDEVSQGLLLSRLQSVRKTGLTYTTDKSQPAPPKAWQIHCHFKDEYEFELKLLAPEKKTLEKVMTSPLSRSPHMTERRRQYFSEITLITAVQHWRD